MGIAPGLFCVVSGLVGTPGQCFAVATMVGGNAGASVTGHAQWRVVAFQPLYQRIVKEQPDLLD